MGIFGNIFGNNQNDEEKDERRVPWIPLTTLDQLKEIDTNSIGKTQVIFKHSTTCGISRMVMNMFTGNYDFTESQLDIYYLDLHAHREVSNQVGYKYQVVHQSPQLLVIRNGIAVTHASHSAITEVQLAQYL